MMHGKLLQQMQQILHFLLGLTTTRCNITQGHALIKMPNRSLSKPARRVGGTNPNINKVANRWVSFHSIQPTGCYIEDEAVLGGRVAFQSTGQRYSMCNKFIVIST